MIMTERNKFIGLLLVLLIISGCMASPVWARTEYSDIEGHKYSKAIGVLSGIGIIEGRGDNIFAPDDNITRAEFVKIVLGACGLLESVSPNISSSFGDTAGHWAESYIAFAESLGYVNGNSDGTFAPDKNVTLEQAAKLLVKITGFGIVADNNGGYPLGYVSTAASKGMLYKVDGREEEKLTRGQVAQLIYNTMQVPMMLYDGTSYHDGNKNDTLMSRLLCMDDTGIVTKVYYTGIDSTVGTGRQDRVEITVDNVIYQMYVGDTNAEILPGCEVDFTAVRNSRDSDEYTLVYINPTSRSTILELTDEELNSLNLAEKEYAYSISDTGKIQKARLDNNVKVIYNNQYLDNPDETDMLPKNGFVRLVENDGDNRYDVVFVYDYENYVIASSSTDYNIMSIYFKSGGSTSLGKVEIEKNPYADNAIVYYNDKYVTTEELFETEINKWTVASVARNKNHDVTEIRLSTKSVTGTVECMQENNGVNEYQISGEWYITAAEFNKSLKLREKYTLVIAYNNKITEINTDTEILTSNYALLLNCIMDNKINSKERVSFKLILADGETKWLIGAEKVKINNNSSKRLTSSDLAQLPSNSLIIYTQNSNGEITKIETADSNNVCMTTNGYIDYGDEETFTLNASTNLYFKNSQPATLGGDVKVNEATLVFDVSSTDDEEWGTGNISLFNSETVYTVDIYDIDRFKRAKVVVNYGPAVEQRDLVPWGNSPVVIRKLINVYDGDEVVTVLNGMQDGHEFEMKLKSDNVCDEERENYLIDLKPGSVVQIKKNILNEIVSIRKLYRAPSRTSIYETLGSKNWEGADYSVKLHTGYGMCVDIDDDIMTVAYRLDGKISAYSISQANIYVFYSKSKILEKGTVRDVKPASSYGYDDCTRVFLRMEKDDVKDIVIYYE